MTDLIDKLSAMRERIDELMKGEEERAAKLENEVAALDMQLLMANALGALRAASADCRHERVRVQVNGARDMIKKALGA